MQVGFASQSTDCSAPPKSISSSEDKSSVNFPGIAACEMCTAFRIRLPSGEPPGSWHPGGQGVKQRDAS